MAGLSHFRVFEDHAEYRPVGEIALPELTRMITAAISHAREQQQRNLLLDITGLSGFEPPSLASRYYFVEEWSLGCARFRPHRHGRPAPDDRLA
jgi:hypothetical protein